MATLRRSPRIAAQAIVPGTPTIKMTITDNTSDAEVEKIKQENRDLRAAQRKERREALTAKTAQLVKMINEHIPSEQDDKINELVAANHAAHNELAQNLANIRINVDKLVAMTDDQHKVILKIVEEVGQLKVQPNVQKPKNKSHNPFKRFYQFITTPFCA